jgi:TctA family transporter
MLLYVINPIWLCLMLTSQIGALIAHVTLFWRKDVWASIKALRTGVSEDRHHAAMLVKYKEVPYWWYVLILVVAFVFGIIVTTTQNITMPVWSYIIALLTGAFVAPFVSGHPRSSIREANYSLPSCIRDMVQECRCFSLF